MKMDDARFLTWMEHATPEERQLAEKVFDLEEHFEDMLLREDTCFGKLLDVERKDLDGEWRADRMPLPDELECFSLTWFRYKVFQPAKSTLGYFNGAKQELGVRADMAENDSTILHELIHLHEFVLEDRHVHLYFRDMLFWTLERQVGKRIPRLDEILENHAHALNQHILYADGGKHDVLFLLKSLDLDMRMGYPLGTVFGYGRSDEFKGYSYLPLAGDVPRV